MKIPKVFSTIAIGTGLLSFVAFVSFTALMLLGYGLICALGTVTFYLVYNPNWKAEDYFDDPAEIALCKAISRSEIAEIDRLISGGVDVNKKGVGGMTFLFWAYPAGEASFKRILEHGGDPNVIYERDFKYKAGGLIAGDTLIFFVINSTRNPHHQYTKHYVKKFENYLQLLIDHGVDINCHRRFGKYTPLHHAIRWGGTPNRKAVQQLIEAEADLNSLNEDGQTPMMTAFDDYETVLLLLEAGADYRIVDKNNYTIAHHVARGVYGRTPQNQVQYNKVVKWLADRDISVERAGEQVDTWLRRREAVKNDYFQRRIPDEVIYGDDIPEGSQAPPPGPSTLTKERLDEYVNNAP